MLSGVHGSGHGYRILADAIIAMDIVFADGELHTLTKDGTEGFNNYLLNFGGLGIITAATIRLVPTYMV